MIELRQLRKVFSGSGRSAGEVLALNNVNLTIRDNEFLTIIGPSGCGKTTLLRIVAGLIPYDQGVVEIDGTPVTGPGPDRAVVFQSFALMPWADVLSNVQFGLEMRGVPRAERESIAMHFIRRVGLSGFERRLPKELSGGMQQRVGLARALAVNPEILLMDEPFGALDQQTRRLLQEELLQMWERDKKTVLFITHSMEEAVFLGDRVILMTPRPGEIKEVLNIPLSRPRGPDSEKLPEFIDLKEYLWDNLRSMQQSPQALDA